MSRQSKPVVVLLSVLLVVMSLLTGCKAQPTPVPTKVPATAVPPTATPAGPTVGGTLVEYLAAEPNSLDPMTAMWVNTLSRLGSALVVLNPEGKYVGYLAESWEVKEGGTVYEFKLKENIKFHNGDPCNAHDYAWTFNRILDPDAPMGGAKALLGPVVGVEALDDYTLKITLVMPYAPALFSLSIAGFYQPLSKAAIEAAGDSYSRNPVGVGPYKLKEWKTGEKIVLERNPEFSWGPDFLHDGPFYIEFIEQVFTSEMSTIVAGFEAGEVDFGEIEAKSVARIEATGNFEIYESLRPGAAPYLALNTAKPPFDDVRVRQAFNYATDREALIKLVLDGNGVAQYGPISPSTIGYWAGIEELGYKYDLDKAKALMAEAGYTEGANGILEKDGEPLKLILYAITTGDMPRKSAEVLKEQWKPLGVDIEIQLIEENLSGPKFASGDFQIGFQDNTYPEGDGMFLMFHSSMLGAINPGQVNDPDLDELLLGTRTATSQESRQEALTATQKMIMEKAYMVPLFAPSEYRVVTKNLKGYVFSPTTAGLYPGYLGDAWFAEE